MQHRSGFLTFIFAFIPGAGQMYLGYTKRGVSLMLAFALICGISGFLNIGAFLVLCPVVWAYAFFDTFALRRMTPEQIKNTTDDFFIDLNGLTSNGNPQWGKWIGIGLVVIGLYAIFDSFFIQLLWDIYYALGEPQYIQTIIYSGPTLLVSLLLIFLGFKLISGSKQQYKEASKDDFVNFKPTEAAEQQPLNEQPLNEQAQNNSDSQNKDDE